MLYLLLGLIALIFSIISSQSKSRIKQIKYLNLTLFILFILWGFEYYNTVDYRVMLEKFNQVVYGKINYEINGDITYIEPLCKLLFYICSPFGNLTYYILVALFEIFVIKIIVIKYIPQKYFWLLMVLILFQFEYTIVLMTLKRQIFAIFVSLLMIYVFNEKYLVWPLKKVLIVSLLLCFIAYNIHKSVIISILFIPLCFLAKYHLPKRLRIIIIFLYMFQYFFDLSAYSDIFFNLIESQDEKYAYYALQISEGGRDTSIIHIIIEFITLSLIIFSLNLCNRKERVFFYAAILYLLSINFFVMDSGRILLPFRICQLFAIPIMISKIESFNKNLSKIIVAVFVIISIKSTYQIYTDTNKASMTEGFKSFNLIFEAPSLQIDNPKSESKKYLPYR